MDPRFARTKVAIHNAIIDLLRERNLSEITVSALCQRAGVNRNTFYAHYNNPTEVVEEISKEFMQEFDKIATRQDKNLDIRVEVCRYLYEHRDVFSVLSSTNAEQTYLKIALAQAKKSTKTSLFYEQSDYLPPYYDEFIVGGCCFVLKEWIEKGAKESPEEIGLTIHKLFMKCKN